MQTVNTYTPCFSGFYHTIWDISYISEAESLACTDTEAGNYDTDILCEALVEVLDYTYYRNEVAKSFTEEVAGFLKDEGFITDHEFEELKSPKNGSINVTFRLSDENIRNIQKAIWRHKKLFMDFLAKRYTARDGFLPHYSNKIEDWESDTDGFRDFTVNGHYLGSVLEFIMMAIYEVGEGTFLYEVEQSTILIESYDMDELIEKLRDLTGEPVYRRSDFNCSECGRTLNKANWFDHNTINLAHEYHALKNKYPDVICWRCADELFDKPIRETIERLENEYAVSVYMDSDGQFDPFLTGNGLTKEIWESFNRRSIPAI